jgi:hypothetical protein
LVSSTTVGLVSLLSLWLQPASAAASTHPLTTDDIGTKGREEDIAECVGATPASYDRIERSREFRVFFPAESPNRRPEC